MSTERQRAANRRNARRSTGPKSDSGKQRASRNSYRHGLTARLAPSAARAKAVEKLARKIVGRNAGAVTLELARSAARAEHDLAVIRQIKVILSGRILTSSNTASPKGPVIDTSVCIEAYKSEDRDPLAAVRSVVPELLKLDRYERRASARRDRAILALIQSKIA